MLIISYDFEENRPRAKFAKFIKKFGRKMQYSVFEVKNSPRVLKNILSEIELKYKKQFSGSDSIVIVPLCEACEKKMVRYGYAANEERDVIIFK
jgi:CRISPR-associated protein Cas2